MSKFTTFKLNNSNQYIYQFLSTLYVSGTNERASHTSVYLILTTTLWGWYITFTSQRRKSLKTFFKTYFKDKYRLLNKWIKIQIQVYWTPKPVLLANTLYRCPIPVLHSWLERGPITLSVTTWAVWGGERQHEVKKEALTSQWVCETKAESLSLNTRKEITKDKRRSVKKEIHIQ